MKKLSNLLLFLPFITLMSCGKGTLDTRDEAIKFLESNNFFDESASVKGKSSDASIKTSFSLSFSNGQVQIGDESIPYTIGELTENVNSESYAANQIKGYQIEFCGSERYAYGGCIKCYLDCGENREDGPSLSVKGDYINAYFSYISEGAIVEK
jgi:hypothetical protein